MRRWRSFVILLERATLKLMVNHLHTKMCQKIIFTKNTYFENFKNIKISQQNIDSAFDYKKYFLHTKKYYF